MTNFGYQVWVAGGTYYPTTTTDRTASFSLGQNVQVYGGFPVNGAFGARNWKTYPTILSGDIGAANYDADNSYHVMANTNIQSLSMLDGFTITKGRGAYGAGVCNVNSDPVFTNCVFLDNQATVAGGGIYSSGVEGSMLVQCSFISNSAAVAGGGMYYNSRTFLENSSFVGNSSFLGGAICFTNTDYAYIYNTLFANNHVAGGAGAGGGAIESLQAGLSVYNSTFAQNTGDIAGTATAVGAAGLDFHSTDSSRLLSIENTIFWNNAVNNASGSVGPSELQQLMTVSTNPYSINNTLIEGLDYYAGESVNANLDVDPLFANPGSGDFRLLRYSPAIDAGYPFGETLLVPTDLAGNSRQANQSIDLGAYEYQGSPLKFSFQISVTRGCDPGGASYTLDLNGSNVPPASFQWEVNKNDGFGFADIPDDGIYSGTGSKTLSIIHPTLDMDGYRYRVRADAAGLSFTSQSGRIHVSPTTIYVKADATGANTGLSWDDAFTNLPPALALAQPCAQIWVAAGTYHPSDTGNVTATLRMKADVAIYGGFAGGESDVSQRDWVANPTILSGEYGDPTATNDNSLNLIYNYGAQIGQECGPSAVLDGFTLRDALDSPLSIIIPARPCATASSPTMPAIGARPCATITIPRRWW